MHVQAAVRVSGLELGGLVGSLIAGRLSDAMIRKAGGKGGNVGKRVQASPAASSRPRLAGRPQQASRPPCSEPRSAKASRWPAAKGGVSGPRCFLRRGL